MSHWSHGACLASAVSVVPQMECAWEGGVELLSLACDYPSGLCQEAACLLRIKLHKQVEDGILKQPSLDQMTQRLAGI